MIYYDHILAQEIVDDEGFRTKSYTDTKGYWTIGVGHFLGKESSFANMIWTPEQIMITFMQDLNVSIYHVKNQIITFDSISTDRQRVLINMMFNLGPYRFSRFVKFAEAVNNLKIEQAYTEMLDSKWAKVDVPNRANRLAEKWLIG